MLHYKSFPHNFYDIKINAKYKFDGKKNNQVQFYYLYNYVYVIFIHYLVQIRSGVGWSERSFRRVIDFEQKRMEEGRGAKNYHF